jgi:hypothetical protein
MDGDIILGIIAGVILYSYCLFNFGYKRGSRDAANKVLDYMDELFGTGEGK